MYVNTYETPGGPHYSRPYMTLEEAVRARGWFEDYLAVTARKLPPHRFTGSLRVTLKDPALARHLQGGRTLFRSLTPVRKAGKPAEPRVDHPPGYVNATELCRAAGRQWSRYWETLAANRNASAVARELNVATNALVHTVRGGDAQRQGTWVHPRIAEHLRAWLGLKEAAE